MNPTDSHDFLVELLRELHQYGCRVGSLRVATHEGRQGIHEVYQSTPQVLGADLQVSTLPPNDDRWTWSFYHFRRASPTTLILGGGLPVEVHEVTLVQLKLLISKSGLGSQRAFQPELGCFLNHSADCDLSRPEVVTRVPGDSARRIIDRVSLVGSNPASPGGSRPYNAR